MTEPTPIRIISPSSGPCLSLSPHCERASDWMTVFARLDRIPVTGYIPTLADLPDRPNTMVYMLDLKRITVVERLMLIAVLAKRFRLKPREVEADLEAHGCPIPAADTLMLVPSYFALARTVGG